jgi:uncharacterized protein YceH (UPF0502 family)
MKNKKELQNKECRVCGTIIEIYTVYTRQQKWKKVLGVCIPCKQKADKELLEKLSPKQP